MFSEKGSMQIFFSAHKSQLYGVNWQFSILYQMFYFCSRTYCLHYKNL
uniref:Uncharacterized protein n=1 Tax=Arundo donax TaxID=35708 RepID=A0A0A9B3S4_ARUDO